MKLVAVIVAILTVSSRGDIITSQFESFNELGNNEQEALQPRIVGGATAMPREFPYQVGLLIVTITGTTMLCGGSIISKNYVLTAAHCLQDAISGVVLAGTYTRNTAVSEYGSKKIIVKSSDFTIHPRYMRLQLRNDIALIKLPEDLTFTEAIQPIALPPESLGDEKLLNRMATASGWGKTGDRQELPKLLQFVNLKLLDQKICEEIYNKQLKLFTANNICTDTSNKNSVCSGDSGGPLALNNDDGSKTLIGIASYVHISGCESSRPAVFTIE